MLVCTILNICIEFILLHDIIYLIFRIFLKEINAIQHGERLFLENYNCFYEINLRKELRNEKWIKNHYFDFGGNYNRHFRKSNYHYNFLIERKLNIMKKIKAFFKGKVFKRIVIYVLVALVVCFSGYEVFKVLNKTEPQLVDTQELKSVLTRSSELTTAKLHLTCLSEFEDTGVKILNRADFMFVYDVTVRAGIDMGKVAISDDNINKVIYISIPHATIQSANVDPATIKYYDEHFSLFNSNEKEDSDKAQKLAQDEAIKKAEKSGILEMADKQSETLITGILSNAIPDGYTIKIAKQ